MTLPGDRDPSPSATPALVQPGEAAAAITRRSSGPIALIVEAGGVSGAAMEARLGADGAIRCERARSVDHAAPLATASGATVILLLPPAGSSNERFEVLGTLHAQADTAALPIVVIDEIGGAEDRRQAFAAGADDYWSGWPDPLEARARLFALSRGVMAERQRDDLSREMAVLRARLGDATSKLAKGQELDDRTGLPTRKRLLEQLDVEWRRARRAGAPLSLVLIEVGRPGPGPRTSTDEERFVRISAALRAVLRRGGDLLARYSENQLAAALPEIGPEGAAAVAQAMRRAAVAADPALSFSTGIVTGRPQESVADGPASLIAEAEESLARARP